MGFLAGQTGVIVPVPGADALVAPWRTTFDSSVPFGVPAHVTLVFPFVPFSALTSTDLLDLRSLCALQAPIDLTLGRCGRFPGVLYLEPEPAAAFVAVILAMASRWPDALPYEGQFWPDITPHLTIADSADEHEMRTAEAEIAAVLPISTRLDHAVLIRFDGDRWVTEELLPFGA